MEQFEDSHPEFVQSARQPKRRKKDAPDQATDIPQEATEPNEDPIVGEPVLDEPACDEPDVEEPEHLEEPDPVEDRPEYFQEKPDCSQEPVIKRKGKEVFDALFVGYDPKFKAKAYTIRSKGRGDSAPKDCRDITVQDAYTLLIAVLTSDPRYTPLRGGVFFKAEEFNDPKISKIYAKVLLYDAEGYGVNVGTKISLEGKKGVVKTLWHGEVEVDFEGELKKMEILDVLDHSDKKQGVSLPLEDRRRFIVFLCFWVLVISVHLANHAYMDTTTTKKENGFEDLAKRVADLESLPHRTSEKTKSLDTYKERLKCLRRVNPLVWQAISTVPAAESVTSVDDSMTAFVAEPGSLVEMLGKKRYSREVLPWADKATIGILWKDEMFCGKGNARALVASASKALQASYRLERFTNSSPLFSSNT